MTRAEFEKARAKYRGTYDRLYLRSMRAGSAEECERIDAALAAANAEYDTAKAAYEATKTGTVFDLPVAAWAMSEGGK